MTFNKAKVVKIISFIALLLVMGLLIYVSIPLIKFIKNPEGFKNWIDSFGIYSPLAYILITILSIIFPIIPGEPLEMVAGYAFGAVKGTIYCLLAECLGSVFVVLIVKKFGRKIVEYFFNKEKIDSLKFLQSSTKRTNIFAIIFTIPGTPKDLLCYFGGLTDIDTKILLLIVTLARFPSIITSTLIGGHLGEQNYLYAIIVFVITAIISLTGIFVYNHIQNKKD